MFASGEIKPQKGAKSQSIRKYISAHGRPDCGDITEEVGIMPKKYLEDLQHERGKTRPLDGTWMKGKQEGIGKFK